MKLLCRFSVCLTFALAVLLFFATTAHAQEYITTAYLRLRTGPSLDDDIIRTVARGTRVYVTDTRDGEWYAVTVGDTDGYMYAAFLSPAPEPGEEDEVAAGAVELLTWSTVRNNVIRNGADLQVTDVRTGITWTMRAFSQGNHADVETVTAADTANMQRAFGGRWTWDTRPIWVTTPDGRRLAASLNGMPHGGSTISGNNMNGHVCMHFLESRTHNGNRSHERDHQNSVRAAYNVA